MSLLSTVLFLATTREGIASFIRAIVWVYTLVIFAHILFSLLRTAGVRIPYNSFTDAVEKFLHDAAEPYLSLFRRFIPPLGGLDLSPIVAFLVLQVVGNLVAGIVGG